MHGTLPTGGNGTYTYQWQKSTTGSGGPYVDIAGATGQNYQAEILFVTTCYRRIAMSPPAANSTSNIVLITVVPPIANNTIAADQTITSGTIPNPLTGTIPTGGNGTYTYQWQSSPAGAGGPFTNINGATGQNYAPPVLLITTWYRRVVSSPPQTNHYSNVVRITVNPVKDLYGDPVQLPEESGNDIKIKLCPNPTTGIVAYKLADYCGSLTINIKNIQGQTISSTNSDVKAAQFTGSIDLTAYPDGIYFIQLITDESSGIYKIVKQ